VGWGHRWKVRASSDQRRRARWSRAHAWHGCGHEPRWREIHRHDDKWIGWRDLGNVDHFGLNRLDDLLAIGLFWRL
jgi:hypothetical protein